MKCTATVMVLFAVVGACSKSGDSTSAAPSGVTASTTGAKPTTDEKGSASQLPAPGTFHVDPTHSTVLFKVRHLGAGYIYGWFKEFSGSFTIDADPKKSHVDLSVKAASVDTRDEERNANIAGPDFLNAKQFPELTFKSTSVDVSGAGWRVTGDLTIHGITKPVTFTAAPVGDGKDPQGTRLVGVEARFPISRGDFGVTFMPGVVGPEMELIIALEGAAG
jgi:polyisoprenoid-binding protein YceI